MPKFTYHARDGQGRPLSGTSESASAAAVAADLRGRGWLIVDLHAARSAPSRSGAAGSFPVAWFRRPPRKLDVETSLRQLALMERSGLPLLRALRASAINAPRAAMARVLDALADRIEAGSSFTEALAAYPRQFPPLTVEMIRAGEHSGSLDLALERCADQMERDRELRASVLQALFYPAIVLLLASAVTLFLVLNVVPVLETFLRSSGKRLPAITQALVETSAFLRLHMPQVAIGLVAAIAVLWALERHPPSRKLIDRALFRLPLVGRVRLLAATARFSRSLATLLDNGIDLVSSLKLCQGILSRPETSDTIGRARDRVLAGESLAVALEGARVFAPILPRMVDVGERAGSLDRVLADVATYHETQLRAWIRRLSAWVEPATTILVGGVVGFVYIAFFVAMFSAAGAVR